MEHIKIERWKIIEQLCTSWRDHYEMMDDAYLILEYKHYISEDPSYPVTVEIKEEK